MKARRWLKIGIDIAMLGVSTALFCFDATGILLHMALGIALLILAAVHNALNAPFWSGIRKGKYTPKRVTQTVWNISLLAVLILTVFSGVLFAGTLHRVSALLFLILTVGHAGARIKMFLPPKKSLSESTTAYMDVKVVTPRMPDYKKVKETYNNAFPRRERLPIAVLHLMACRGNVDFLAFYDKGQFCGIAYLIREGRTTLLFYLAVEESLRSKGYGSAILNWIAKNTTETVLLDAEAVGEKDSSPNWEQRVQRQQFYYRNGYQDAGLTMRQYGEVYDVLYRGAPFERENLEQLLKHFSFGFSRFIFCIEEKPRDRETTGSPEPRV